MKIYKAAIIGLGPSGLAVNKLIYNNNRDNIIAFENTDFSKRNNYFGFWLTDWMKPYEKLIEKKWSNWLIGNNNIEIIHNEKKHPYCVISYKSWMQFCLDTINKLKIVNKKVVSYKRVNNYFKIYTDDNQEFLAEYIYDSRSIKQRDNELIQHFYGLNISTKDKTFDDKQITLMHFTEEDNLLHFIYVLPFAHNKALIESTVFSKEILNENWYRNKIYDYLKKFKIIDYTEESVEKGIIPMFFANEEVPKDPNIFNIGIRGGACKPSTGYVFAFLIKQIQLLNKTNKNNVNIHSLLQKKMDKIFLSYLKTNTENGKSFIKLAKNLNGYEFQNFMMGQPSFLTKLKIIKSMPKYAFIKAIFK